MAPMQSLFFLFAMLGVKVCAETCTLEQVGPCIQPYSSMDTKDMSKMCQTISTAINCFEGLKGTCDLDAEQSKQMEVASGQAQSVCQENCQLDDIQKCSKQPTDLDDTCPFMMENMKCLTDLMSRCEGKLKTVIEQSLNSMKEVAAMCEGASSGCGLSDVQKCVSLYEKLEGQDSSKMCGIMKQSETCLRALRPKCKGEMLKQIDEGLTKMGPIDNKCCEGIVMVQTECVSRTASFAETFSAKDDECLMMENAWACINKNAPKCKDGPLKQGMDEAIQGIEGRLKQCTESGYNMTLYLEQTDKKGGNGVDALYPAVALILSALIMGRLQLF